MSASAIIMMCIACVGLWGGALVSLAIMFKSSKKTPGEVLKDIEEAEPETYINE
ncbi:MAG: MetS family NSS transporter small subunit [Firmicutes bacterium]|nr:MetS family NSS transporter small subunit [Bacillota bacterium]